MILSVMQIYIAYFTEKARQEERMDQTIKLILRSRTLARQEEVRDRTSGVIRSFSSFVCLSVSRIQEATYRADLFF
jgi:hypothetical protein